MTLTLHTLTITQTQPHWLGPCYYTIKYGTNETIFCHERDLKHTTKTILNHLENQQ
jgi:hypothetical protein